jgi:hypothetical protein
LPSPPKNGRIERYLEVFQKCKTPEQKYAFENTIFRDSMNYLKKELEVIFPDIRINYIYRQSEYHDLFRRLDEIFGKKPYTNAVTVGSPDGNDIYINVKGLFGGQPADFIVNLCLSFIEGLIHIAYPRKSETQVHDIVCTIVEEFIEIKLPDDVKEARMKYSKELDESK